MDITLLNKFRKQRIIVMGDILLDEYILGNCSRLSPEAPVPVLAVEYSYEVLGGAANTAANIASLGGAVDLIGLVGDDEDGKLLTNKAYEQGIQFIPVIGERPTIKKTRLLGQKQQLLRIDYEEVKTISDETEAEIFQAFSNILPSANMVVLSDYAKGFFTKSLCDKIIKASYKAGIQVIIDPKPSHNQFYHNCSFLTPNWKESLQLGGFSHRALTYEAAEEVAYKIKEKFNSGVLLTLGSKGVFFLDKKSSLSFYLPTQSREVYDVSGAGDTVVAVFALTVASGLSYKESVQLSNQAAGAVVGKMGTAIATPEDLEGMKNHKHKLLSRKDLGSISAYLKSRELKIVTINGSFDLLHHGHLHILKQAKMQGDILIVGLNSDSSVKKLKGSQRPLISQKQRAEMLLALEYVDYVHIFDEDIPMPFLEEIKPHVHVNGSEYGAKCIEAETVKKNGGKIHIVKKIKGISTSELLNKIARILNSQKK